MRRFFSARALSGGQTATGIDYQRNLQVVAIVGMAAMTGFALGFFVLLARYRDPKILIPASIALFSVTLCWFAYSLARAGNQVQAAVYVFLGFALAVPPLPLVFSGVSNLVVLVSVVIFLAVGLLVLQPRLMYWVVAINLLEVLVYVLINRYPPFDKISAPELHRLIWPVIVLASLVILAGLLWIFRYLDLAGKLIVAYTVVTLGVTGAFGYMTQSQTSGALRTSVGGSLKSAVLQRSHAVGDVLESQVNTLKALAVNETLQRRVSNSNQFYPDAPGGIQARLNEADLLWRELVAANNLSDAHIAARLENEVALDLREYSQVFPYNSELILTDIHGGLIAASGVTTDYYQGDEFWWSHAYSDGRGAVYVSKPAFDESIQADGVTIAVPVRGRETGAVVGVLRTTVLVQAVVDILNAGTEETQATFDLYFPGEVVQRISAGSLNLASPELAARLQDVSSQPFTEMTYDEQAALVAQEPVVSSRHDTDIAGLGWYVVGHVPADLALAPVQAQSENSLAVTAIIVALVSLLAVAVSQAFASPIANLTETAEQIRAGNLNLQAQVRSTDEVGRLAQAFNGMTSRLRETLASLEQRISDRTRELTLAGNVGRTLSQERNLDRLIKLSVELVRSSFDLYYTQIYLTDANQRALILRAGSGNVGAELARRGHRLAIGPGSVNGSAAANREAVIVADTTRSPGFRPNTLLPETRSEMAVPLLIGERVVGVLDMQSRRPGALTADSLPAFQALAGQLAIAVDNALLLAETQQARQELERQARRMVRSAWEEYLDGIQRQEKLGYEFDRSEVRPLAERPQDEHLQAAPEPDGEPAAGAAALVLESPILVTGERVGGIRLERQSGQAWTTDETELVNIVARQVARQVDSLRLLEQAERFRQEAEAAARRLVREGWEAFATEQSSQAYRYDQNQVLPAAANAPLTLEHEPAALRLPLYVRGEPVGELLVAGAQTLAPAQQQLAQVVADRLSAHLENLRLSAQTQTALAVTEKMYQGSEQVVRAATMQEVLRALAENTSLRQFAHGSVMLFNRAWTGDDMPESATIAALWEQSGQAPETPLGFSLPLRALPASMLVHPGQAIFTADLEHDERLDVQSRQALGRLGQSAAIFPLVAGSQWIGWLSMAGDASVHLTEEDMRQVQSLAAQAAAVLQGLRLLEQSQNRAERERVLRQVAERVRSVADPEQVLRTAAREVGTALGRNVLVRLASDPQK